MNRGGIGSASIVLVFAVLGLTIFSVISLIPAMTSQRLIQAEVQLVQDFYEADTIAVKILSEILASDVTPYNVLGVEIFSDWDWDLLAEVIWFTTYVTENRVLSVEILRDFDFYQITAWRMHNLSDWEADDTLNVWTGDFDFDFD